MVKLLRMPEVAAGATEAVVQSWSVQEAAAFSATDTIVSVETDKAVVDIDADEDGVLLKVLQPAGAQVEAGTPIALLGSPGETVTDLARTLADLGVSAGDAVGPSGAGTLAATHSQSENNPSGGPASARPTPTSGTAQNPGDAGRTSGDRTDGDKPGPRATTSSPGTRSGTGTDQWTGTSGGNGSHDGGRVFVSPLARRLAREQGLDPAGIAATGPGGRVVRRDVEAALAARATAATAQVPTGPTAPVHVTPDTPAASPPVRSEYVDLPHSRLTRAVARRLTAAKQEIPHFYLRAGCQVDALLAARADLNAAGGQHISINDLVVKCVGAALVQVPEMNAIWTDDAVRRFSSVDVSVAVQTPRGLLTPVLRNLQSMTVSEISAQMRDFVSRAAEGRLQQSEIEGGAFSVSNLGMHGTAEFAAIINPPQAGILAVGAARPEPVVRDGSVTSATVMHVTLSADHRTVDGTVAARWLRSFVSFVEKPVLLLA